MVRINRDLLDVYGAGYDVEQQVTRDLTVVLRNPGTTRPLKDRETLKRRRVVLGYDVHSQWLEHLPGLALDRLQGRQVVTARGTDARHSLILAPPVQRPPSSPAEADPERAIPIAFFVSCELMAAGLPPPVGPPST